MVLHFVLVPRWGRYMSLKSCIHNRCGTLRKERFPTMGYAEIHQQSPFFFDNRKDIFIIVVLKIQMVSICNGTSSIHRLLVFWKMSNLNFWWYFKVLQANCLWTNFGNILGNFGQIILHCQWLTTCPYMG